MRKIRKGYNLVLIFTLIGVFLCQNIVYSDSAIRVPLGIRHERMEEGVSPERFVFSRLDSMVSWVEENVESDPDILVLPYLWIREWKIRKSNFRQAIEDFVRSSPEQFPEPTGPAAVSVVTAEDGEKRYAVILSEFSTRDGHPGEPGQFTTVYHSTPIENALSIINGGKYAMPGRLTFYRIPHSNRWGGCVLLPFKLPNRHLIIQKDTPPFSTTQLGLDFTAPYYKRSLPLGLRDIYSKSVAKLNKKGTSLLSTTTAELAPAVFLSAEKTGFLMHLPFTLSAEEKEEALKINRWRVRDGTLDEADYRKLWQALDAFPVSSDTKDQPDQAIASEVRLPAKKATDL